MTRESRRLAGIILILVPAVAFGGASLLSMILGEVPGYLDNALRQDLWRAGHAHAGVFLLLSLIALRYVDEAVLSERAKWIVRSSIPAAAIIVPFAFFFSVLTPDATKPNGLIQLAYVGAAVLAVGVIILGIGLLRKQPPVGGRA